MEDLSLPNPRGSNPKSPGRLQLYKEMKIRKCHPKVVNKNINIHHA